jgi:hypothetical protein
LYLKAIEAQARLDALIQDAAIIFAQISNLVIPYSPGISRCISAINYMIGKLEAKIYTAAFHGQHAEFVEVCEYHNVFSPLGLEAFARFSAFDTMTVDDIFASFLKNDVHSINISNCKPSRILSVEVMGGVSANISKPSRILSVEVMIDAIASSHVPYVLGTWTHLLDIASIADGDIDLLAVDGIHGNKSADLHNSLEAWYASIASQDHSQMSTWSIAVTEPSPYAEAAKLKYDDVTPDMLVADAAMSKLQATVTAAADAATLTQPLTLLAADRRRLKRLHLQAPPAG